MAVLGLNVLHVNPIYIYYLGSKLDNYEKKYWIKCVTGEVPEQEYIISLNI